MHGHDGRCGTRLTWFMQDSDLAGGWRAVQTDESGAWVLENCMILCPSCQAAWAEPIDKETSP